MIDLRALEAERQSSENADRQKIYAQIIQRLSLRRPQTESLKRLKDVVETIDPSKDTDSERALESIKALYPSIDSFEREFPSFCFTLATGVGKTRLMGAFISYLFLTGKSRNFFVLAPNLTIYEKLLADFRPGDPKYVFKGIDAFATQPPVIVNADNYEEGRGVRGGDLFGREGAIINIFNISKINSEVRGGRSPRIKRLQEYIGESYFDYLASLPDLVLLMDEAHRYRASAGAKAIGELKPILGLELTATPKAVGTNAPFKNIIYQYDLPEAMADGYVKEPAVGTRANFRDDSVADEKALERIKLEDGVHYHEHVRVQLQTYAQQNEVKLVHPFMLVVATTTQHAEDIKKHIESAEFFGGRYAGRVLTVHSALGGEESEKTAAALLEVESSGKIDIVIHVNKLKEGWDVTNLFTIVPLRASTSEILTEQTLGRGLRLPYGKRTGVEAVDTLTVIAHDRFNEIIETARNNHGLIHKQVTIGEGGTVSTRRPVVVEALSVVQSMLRQTRTTNDEAVPGLSEPDGPRFTFDKPDEVRLAETTITQVLPLYRTRVAFARDLTTEKVMQQITRDVMAIEQASGDLLTTPISEERAAQVVREVCEAFTERTIAIPELVMTPVDQVSFGFKPFTIQGLDRWNYQPITRELLIQVLRTEKRSMIMQNPEGDREPRLEDYVIRHLIDYDEVDYDGHSELLNGLAGQVVARLRSYLTSGNDLHNVLQANGRAMAAAIFTQMRQNMWRTDTAFRVSLRSAFTVLRPQAFDASGSDCVRDLRSPPERLGEIRRFIFSGCRRGCYPLVKFDSDPERQFAVLLEGDPTVEKWMKPGPGQFRIEDRDGQPYLPDFVVETAIKKFIIEVKRADAVSDEEVLRKADSARVWCYIATKFHSVPHGEKPWDYVLIPHDAIRPDATISGLLTTFTRPPDLNIEQMYKFAEDA